MFIQSMESRFVEAFWKVFLCGTTIFLLTMYLNTPWSQNYIASGIAVLSCMTLFALFFEESTKREGITL